MTEVLTRDYRGKRIRFSPAERRRRHKEQNRKWGQAHKEYYRRAQKECNKKKKTFWGSNKRLDGGMKLRDRGRNAEKIAQYLILPNLGFEDIWAEYNKGNHFFVDFVATYQGKRVLIDVTTGIRKYFIHKAKLARALRMPLHILFISPDLNKYWLTKDVSHQNTVRLRIKEVKIFGVQTW